MINFKSLFGLDDFFDGPIVGDPAAEAEEKAKRERIDFHRSKVRNGPVSFKVPTNGQLRRAEKRRMDRQMKRNHRSQVRTYFATQREGAVLRGQLQAVGVLPYGLGTHAKITEHGAKQATGALINRLFEAGKVVDPNIANNTERLIVAALQDARDRWCDIVGLPHEKIGATA